VPRKPGTPSGGETVSKKRRIKKMSNYVSRYFNNALSPRRINQAFINRALVALKRYHGNGTERALRRIARHIRPYSSFFKWAPRQKAVEEVGVARTLVEAVGGSPLDFVELLPQAPDPPDVVGVRPDGRRAAMELAELIDEEAVSRSIPALKEGHIQEVVHYKWDQPTLITAIAVLLDEKDKKKLLGGPYAEYIVLLYTDEYLLTYADARQWLEGHTFTGINQATSAYLLFS
jgi:hypothetical protein